MKKILTIFFIMLFTLPAVAASTSTSSESTTAAANRTISGTVLDEKDAPLPGASVVLTDTTTGTTTGTATDVDGKFNLTIPAGTTADTLTISFIGYKPQELSINNILENSLSVKLYLAPHEIEEVVVTAQLPKLGAECKSPQSDYLENSVGPYKIKMVGDKQLCVAEKCKGGFDLNANNKCVAISGSCQDKDLLPLNAASGTRTWDSTAGKEICRITACNGGFDLKENKCVSVSGPCDKNKMPENSLAANRVRRGNSEICIPEKCVAGYEIDNEKCVLISGPCPENLLPVNAASGNRKFDAGTQQEICIPDTCNVGYKLVNGACESELSQEESAKKLDELRENADAMKEKEQSTANKLLGGAAIGAGAIGGSQFLSAQAEKNADADAERDMKAYLATFRCDFGQGKNITGGTKDIILPGGNDLMPLYTEYKALATELKTTKTALGLRQGIESETIFDKADTGLYDNESAARQGGAFSSLSRALSDSTSQDAADLAAQKSDTATKAKTGAIVAGVGIVGGAVGNLLINKNAPKESSDKINEDYKNKANQKSDTAPSVPTEKTAKTEESNKNPASTDNTPPNQESDKNNTLKSDDFDRPEIDSNIITSPATEIQIKNTQPNNQYFLNNSSNLT